MSQIQAFSGTFWQLHDTPLDQVQRFCTQYDLPEFLARLLIERGIDFDAVPAFLNPSFQNDFPDPALLAGMSACAADLAQALMAGKRFGVLTDFDVDGATSAAVVIKFLKMCGAGDVPLYVPERLSEGYGPNKAALACLKDQGAEIVLILDCGSSADQVLQDGADLGLQIVVVDHHHMDHIPQAAWHIINPKRPDDTSGLDMLAAVGVSFMLCVAVNAALRAAGFYGGGRAEPALKRLVDLVALGTVCDLVPLTGVNRLFVKQGFALMNAGAHAGLRALAEVSGIEPPFNPYHAGYILGPRINAGSRTGKSALGARLLSFEAEQAEEAKDIAWQLHDCNQQRKAMQESMETQAMQKIAAAELDQDEVIFVSSEGWHSGLTGLVAGRVKEAYKKPACVIVLEEDADGLVGKGSGRSVPGVHMGAIFAEALAQGLLLKGGGHAMAGGFTVLQDQLPAFCEFVQAQAKAQLAGQGAVPPRQLDAVVTVRGAMDVSTAERLQEQLGPFGQGFEEPVFLLKRVRLYGVSTLKDSHIRMQIAEEDGGPRMKAIAFGAVGSAMGQALLADMAGVFDIMGVLKINEWQGRKSVEMHVLDAARS